jgi:hypothetical protein
LKKKPEYAEKIVEGEMLYGGYLSFLDLILLEIQLIRLFDDFVCWSLCFMTVFTELIPQFPLSP